MSLFESDDQWEAIESRTRDIIGAESVPYDPGRVGHFIDRACYSRNLGKDYRPLPQDNYTFINAILARHLEETDRLEETDERRRGRIAELAFLLDGLYGVDYPDLGRIYKSNLKLVAKDGSYTAWRGAIGRAAKLVAEDIAHPSSSALDETLTPTLSRNSKVYETQASQLPKDPLYLPEPLPELPLVHDLMLRDGVVELYHEGRASAVYAQGMMVLFEKAVPNVEGDSWSAKNKIIQTLQQTAYDLQRRLRYGPYPHRIEQGLESDEAFTLGASYLSEIIY